MKNNKLIFTKMSDIPRQLFEIYQKNKCKYLMNNDKISIIDNNKINWMEKIIIIKTIIKLQIRHLYIY